MANAANVSSARSSELVILAFTALAYIPLGLISILRNYLSLAPYKNKGLSEFAWLLIIFAIIELILGIIWYVQDDGRY